MEISKKLFGVIIGFVVIFGLGAAFAFAGTTSDGSTFFEKHHKIGFMSQLTEEQMDILMQTKMDLKEEEATREEMHAAMKDLYEEWGIELPEWDHEFKSGYRSHYLKTGYTGEGCKYDKNSE